MVSIERAVSLYVCQLGMEGSKWWRDIEIQELCKMGNMRLSGVCETFKTPERNVQAMSRLTIQEPASSKAVRYRSIHILPEAPPKCSLAYCSHA